VRLVAVDSWHHTHDTTESMRGLYADAGTGTGPATLRSGNSAPRFN